MHSIWNVDNKAKSHLTAPKLTKEKTIHLNSVPS